MANVLTKEELEKVWEATDLDDLWRGVEFKPSQIYTSVRALRSVSSLNEMSVVQEFLSSNPELADDVMVCFSENGVSFG